jgi:hypothetical protein
VTLSELGSELKDLEVLSMEVTRQGGTWRVTFYGRSETAPEYASKSRSASGDGRSLSAAFARAREAWV